MEAMAQWSLKSAGLLSRMWMTVTSVVRIKLVQKQADCFWWIRLHCLEQQSVDYCLLYWSNSGLKWQFPKINHGVTCGYSFITLDSHMHTPVIPTEGCAEPKNHRNENRLVSVFLTCSSSIYCLP